MIDFNKYFEDDTKKTYNPTPTNKEQVGQNVQTQREWMRAKESGATNLGLQDYIKQGKESPLDQNYVSAMKSVYQPTLDVNNQRRVDLDKYRSREEDRIQEISDLLKKYKDEAVAGQAEKRQAQTMQTTQEAFNREKQYGTLKSGQEKTMLANMAQAGAIGSTGAVDVADIGIEKEYEGNIDNIRLTKTKVINEINDAYIIEKDRLERQYINDDIGLQKELSALNKEYDEAIYALDASEADLISKIKEGAMNKKSESDAAVKKTMADAFLAQVARGAYNELGDEAINAKAKEIYGDTKEAEALAFQARVIKGSLNDPNAMKAKADEIITALATSGSNDRFTGAMAEEIKRRVLAGEDATTLLAEYNYKSRTLPKSSGGGSSGTTIREVVLGYDEDLNPIKANQVWQNGVPLYTVDAYGNIIESEGEAEAQPIEATVQPETPSFQTIDDAGFKPTLGSPSQGNVYYDSKTGLSRNAKGEIVKYINGQWVVQKPLA